MKLIVRTVIEDWKTKNYNWGDFQPGMSVRCVLDKIDYLTGEIWFFLPALPDPTGGREATNETVPD